jgi:hypothetical protein
MDKIVTLYNFFKAEKKKERFDIILEPLQALTQLSALAFCPIGSKLTISNNLLYIQIPGWGQGLLRTFNNDKRDDLFYLFNVIIRFNTFYGYLKTANESSDEDAKLFKLLIKLAKQGIDNLLLTYSAIDQPSLLHTLHMYRTLLDNPELVIRSSAGQNITATVSAAYAISENAKGVGGANGVGANGVGANGVGANGVGANGGSANGVGANGVGVKPYKKQQQDVSENTEITTTTEDTNSKKSINDVFIHIRKLYSPHERSLLYHLLTLMEKRHDQFQTYIDAINSAMNPVNNQIKKWINDNIVY